MISATHLAADPPLICPWARVHVDRHCNNCTIHWSPLHLQLNYWHIKDWRWLDFVLDKHINGSWNAIQCIPWLAMVSGSAGLAHDNWPCQCLGAELGGDMKTDCAPRDCMLSAPSPSSGGPPPWHHGKKWFIYGAIMHILEINQCRTVSGWKQ